MATGDSEPSWFLVFMPLACYCGSSYLAVFRTRFERDHGPDSEPSDFSLIHVEGTAFGPPDGVYRGKRVKAILGCFLRRWSAIADHIVVCTPFISSRFTKGEWEWLFAQSSPYLSHVITRPQSIARMKWLPVFRRGGNELEWMEHVLALDSVDVHKTFEERVISPFLTESTVLKYQKFHSKFYAGILSDRVETVLSSYNLFQKEDTQLEQICLRTYPPPFFVNQFLAPFGMREIHSPQDRTLELKNEVEVVLYSVKTGKSKRATYTNRIWGLVQEETKSSKLPAQ